MECHAHLSTGLSTEPTAHAWPDPPRRAKPQLRDSGRPCGHGNHTSDLRITTQRPLAPDPWLTRYRAAMCAAPAAAPIVSSELSGRALRPFSSTAACGARSCQADHVGESSEVAGLPGGFCSGLQQAGGQFRKSQQVRATCRAAGVAYQRVQPRVQPGRGVPG